MTSPADRPSPAMGRDPIEIAAMDATVSWLAERKARNQFIDEHGDLETGFYLGNLHARRAASQDAERLRSAQDAVWNEAILRAAAIVDDTSVLSCRNPYAGDDGRATLKEARNDILALLRPLTPPRDPQ